MNAAVAIYPTWRSVGVMAAGGPVIVLLAFVGRPEFWIASLVWIGLAILALSLDAILGASAASMRLDVLAPTVIETGGRGSILASFHGTRTDAVELAVEADALLDVQPPRQSLAAAAVATFHITPRRRGQALLRALHVRWQGPLGLVWKQHVQGLDHAIAIVPNVSFVKEEATRMFSRIREAGAASHMELAPSMEIRALREFQHGDDSRNVGWRQSARHRKLLVRETVAERNKTIVFAFDTGRLMCEPLDRDMPRIDRAINAALLMAYVGLKLGDRVGIFAFDAHPGVASGAVAGIAAFAPLQRLAARIDYTTEETNFTLGLSALGSTLNGRTLVVIFTEFSDTTGAALMVNSIGHLLARHLVLFVTFQDAELDAMVRSKPLRASDISRAVVAGGLSRERETVLGRLRRLGVDVLDVPAREAGPALLRRYLALKREDRL